MVNTKNAPLQYSFINRILREGTVKKVLSPPERIAEILFGVIMTLSITGTLSVISEGHTEVGVMLLGALGCNIAWGLIDAILYLLGTVSENTRGYAMHYFVKHTTDKRKARAVITEALPDALAEALEPKDIETIRKRIVAHHNAPKRKILWAEDGLGALGVFLLVVLSCVPLLIPFIVFHDPLHALRASNIVAIVMLFLCGYFLAKHNGLSKIVQGLGMVLLGILLVGITIFLGG